MKKVYWRYALGEVLIVIIGISMAFSMNKCSENSKNKTLKYKYLESLVNDLEIDKNQLETNTEAIEKKIETLKSILPLFNSSNLQEKRGVFKMFPVANLTDFTPKDITYQTMINSGDFKLIEDLNIKTAIETHYSNYKTILKHYKRQEIINKDYFGNYMIHHVDYDAMRDGKLGLEDEKLLKNILQSMHF